MRPRLHQKLKNRVKVSASVRLIVAGAAITALVAIGFIIYALFGDREVTLAGSDENKLLDFSYRVPVLIDKSFIRGQETFYDFPLAIVLQHNDFKSIQHGGRIINTNEPDFAITKQDGISSLNFSIEHYDPISGSLTAWINYDTLNTKISDSLYVYYSSTVPRKASKLNAVPKDMTAKMSFHKDANAYCHQLVQTKSTGTKNANGIVGGAKLFNHTAGDMAHVNFHKGFTLGESFTMSVWVKPIASGKKQTILSTFDEMDGGYMLTLNEKLQPEFIFLNEKNQKVSSLQNKNEPIEINTWNHIAIVGDPKSMTLNVYVNGVPEKSIPINSQIKASALGMMLGMKQFDEHPSLHAMIDELQIFNTAKSPVWIASSFFNQAKAKELFAFGTPESLETTDATLQSKNKSALDNAAELDAETLIKQYKQNEKLLNKKALELKAKSSNPEEIQARLNYIRKVANANTDDI